MGENMLCNEQGPDGCRFASLPAEGRPISSPAEGRVTGSSASTGNENSVPQTRGLCKSPKARPRKGSAAAKRKRAQRVHAIARFCIQIVFFILAPGLFSSALGGVKYLCTQLGGLEVIEPTAFVASLAFVVGYTVAFGRFFCGYACAFGTMGDVLFTLASPLRRALHVPELQGHPRLLSCLQAVKLVVLAGVCVLCFLGVWDAVAAWDPWAVFGKVTSGAGVEGIAKKGAGILVVIMVMQALFERSFCRFLCPMGALFSLLPVLPFSVFNRQRSACGKKCNHCQDVCPVDIHPDQGSFHSGECIACGRCAVGCPLGNVNLVFVPEVPVASATASEAGREDDSVGPSLAVGAGEMSVEVARKPAKKPAKKPDALLKVKGSGIGWVLGKAVVLLALCWLVGLVRFAPSPAAVLPFALPWL